MIAGTFFLSLGRKMISSYDLNIEKSGLIGFKIALKRGVIYARDDPFFASLLVN